MDGLVYPFARSFSRDASKTRARENAKCTCYTAGNIRKDISKGIIGMDDAVVKPLRVKHHQHRQTVGELMLQVNVCELSIEYVGCRASPKSPTREDICFISAPDNRFASVVRLFAARMQDPRNGSTHTGQPLNLRSRINPKIGSFILTLFFLSKIRTAAVFPYNDELGPCHKLRLYW
ncbi:hypothetical protein HG531_013099 [Fusarium graminearum]|nr:hypothetical protein HG531_013099 [Fusarium graminearum]